MNKKILIIILCLLPLLSFAREVDVLCINDLHGNVMSYDKNLGMAKLATVIKNKIKHHPNTIVVFGGDNYAGSPVSDYFRGAPVTDLIHELHITASAVGNHEFDNGVANISKLAHAGHFTFVAANIFNMKTNQPVKWTKPYIMVKKGGVKIAFIGLATQETPYTIAPGEAKGLVFKDPAKCAQHWINYLKAGRDPQGKPDIIIALTHIPSIQDGATGKITASKELFSLCNNTKGLDAVISAHSHKIVHGFVNHIPVVQGYCYGRTIASLKIKINRAGHVAKIIPQVDLVYKRKKDISPDKQAEVALKHYIKLLPKKYKKVLAVSTGKFLHSTEDLTSHPLDTWLCSLLQKDLHTQISMMNGGFVRGDLQKGPVTILELKRIAYFPNELITLRLSGRNLYKFLEKSIPHGLQFSGIKVYYRKHARKNHHVKKILLGSKPIKRDKYYSIVINSFMLAGGNEEDFSHAIDIVHTHKSINKELMRLIKQQKIIRPVKESKNTLILI
ncbi:MAG: 5'-nucleotidase C-terminal domain-containing protein [Gammaproteobacteria bacterium]|jgi:2',3'-cyclic-nucleotide 2'-phosphodiesterase/3'-nucleotidase